MDKKYLFLSVEDDRLKTIAEIFSNKTSKKIIDFLSETKEGSEKDMAEKLNMPINTIEYNLKKMIQSGILEESKKFFWSPKGRKIKMYKLSNKSIIISPRYSRLNSEIKQIVPVALISGLVSIALKYYFDKKEAAQEILQESSTALYAMGKTAEAGTNIINTGNYWIWFLAGTFFAIVLFIIIKIAMYPKSIGWKN